MDCSDIILNFRRKIYSNFTRRYFVTEKNNSYKLPTHTYLEIVINKSKAAFIFFILNVMPFQKLIYVNMSKRFAEIRKK